MENSELTRLIEKDYQGFVHAHKLMRKYDVCFFANGFCKESKKEEIFNLNFCGDYKDCIKYEQIKDNQPSYKIM